MNNDYFQYKRALDAKVWLDSQESRNLEFIDKQLRIKADIKSGHSLLCSLTKCHKTCRMAK